MSGAATGTNAQSGPGHPSGSASRRRLILAVGYVVGAAVGAGLAWWLAGRGMATDSWPAFAPGADHTDIARYSGPWLSAAAGALLAAALLVVAAVRHVARSRDGAVAGPVATPGPPRAEALR